MGGNHSVDGRTVLRKSGACWIVVSVVLAGLGVVGGAQSFSGDMSFFVSSAGSGKGADLGASKGRTGFAEHGPKPLTMVGHSDRTGLDESAAMKSWNSSHPSRGPGGGCSQDDLKSPGGLFYWFAADKRGSIAGMNRKKPAGDGGTGVPAPPLLYLSGEGRQGLLHNLLHSPRGGDAPHELCSIGEKTPSDEP
jgi:hypothetical protein